MTRNDALRAQLAVGNVLLHEDTLYIVESGPPVGGGDVTVGVLGEREVKAKHMFSVGDDCPLPQCDGEVVEGESAQYRECSEGCLVWQRNYAAEGDDCPSLHCDDGDVVVEKAYDGQYTTKCTECERFAFGPIKWREAWQNPVKEEAIAAVQETSTTA
ncbi:hypothetical protein [Salinibaculum rarum]|uniref:hypothetical protein n=1 Tax=Salinibaculum rarum TaxID=3058903 RepID=UPI00265DB97A|nr:hypothetical protein [Salinibaculum sp. KK48]